MSAPSVTAAVERHPVGPVDAFEKGTFRIFEIQGRPVGVVRTARGFFAVRNRCPHQGADICAGLVSGTMTASRPQQYAYSDERMVVVCPWHRWEFDLGTGESVGQVTNKRLVTYRVEVEDGEVFVLVRGRRTAKEDEPGNRLLGDRSRISGPPTLPEVTL